MHVRAAANIVRRLARDTVQIQRSPIEAGFAVRCTVGVAVPLAISLAIGHPGLGVAAAGGALCVGFASRQGVYRTRAAATVLTAVGMAFSTFIGGLAGRYDPAIIALTALWGFLYGIVASLGPTATSIGQNSALALVIASVFRFDPLQALTQALLVMAGGLLQTLLLVVVWPFRQFRAERTALSVMYRALASYAGTIPHVKLAPPDPRVYASAWQVLADPHPFARRGEVAAFQGLLDEARRIHTRLGALATARHLLESRGLSRAARAIDTLTAAAGIILTEIADALDAGRAPQSSAVWDTLDESAEALERASREISDPLAASIANNAAADASALLGQLRSAWLLAELPADSADPRARGPAPVPLSATSEAVTTLLANLSPGSVYFRHALRLSVTLAVASIVDRLLPFQRGYWAPLTALIVLRPDFSTTFSRGAGRVIGTLAGAALATLVAATIKPGPEILVVLIVLFAFLCYVLINVNFALYSVTITSYVVFLLALIGLPEKTAVYDRVIATTIGGALALIAYALFPTWERGRVASSLAMLLEKQRAHANHVLNAYIDPLSYDEKSIAKTQMAAWVARTNAEASVDRLLTEPVPPRAIDVRTALGILGASRRFGLAVLALQAHIPEAPVLQRPMLSSPAKEHDASMEELAAALRGGRAPQRLPPLRETQLELLKMLERRPKPDIGVIVAELELMVDAIETMVELLQRRPS
ncbi:MAG: FUSC family protein [Vulcanimicrobiaceae bacterium]